MGGEAVPLRPGGGCGHSIGMSNGLACCLDVGRWLGEDGGKVWPATPDAGLASLGASSPFAACM